LTAKYLYNRNDDLKPMQMLLFRSMWATLIMLIVQNVNFKKNCYDSI